MCSRIWNLVREHFALSIKCSSVLFLFSISILIVACGANNSTAAPGAPPVTVTINLDQTFASPTPPLPPYSCGAWATQTTPSFSSNGLVSVYGKYVQNVSGNPVGMDRAAAVATVNWPGGSATTYNTQTSSDGLAVFQVPLQPEALNHVVLVSITFTSSDGQHTCTVPQPAFFTAINVSPTPSPTPSSTPGGGQSSPTPTITVTSVSTPAGQKTPGGPPKK